MSAGWDDLFGSARTGAIGGAIGGAASPKTPLPKLGIAVSSMGPDYDKVNVGDWVIIDVDIEQNAAGATWGDFSIGGSFSQLSKTREPTRRTIRFVPTEPCKIELMIEAIAPGGERVQERLTLTADTPLNWAIASYDKVGPKAGKLDRQRATNKLVGATAGSLKDQFGSTADAQLHAVITKIRGQLRSLEGWKLKGQSDGLALLNAKALDKEASSKSYWLTTFSNLIGLASMFFPEAWVARVAIAAASRLVLSQLNTKPEDAFKSSNRKAVVTRLMRDATTAVYSDLRRMVPRLVAGVVSKHPPKKGQSSADYFARLQLDTELELYRQHFPKNGAQPMAVAEAAIYRELLRGKLAVNDKGLRLAKGWTGDKLTKNALDRLNKMSTKEAPIAEYELLAEQLETAAQGMGYRFASDPIKLLTKAGGPPAAIGFQLVEVVKDKDKRRKMWGSLEGKALSKLKVVDVHQYPQYLRPSWPQVPVNNIPTLNTVYVMPANFESTKRAGKTIWSLNQMEFSVAKEAGLLEPSAFGVPDSITYRLI